MPHERLVERTQWPPHVSGSAPLAASGRRKLGPGARSKADALALHAPRPRQHSAASREHRCCRGCGATGSRGRSREPRGALRVTRAGCAGRPTHRTAWAARATCRCGACAPLRRRPSTCTCVVVEVVPCSSHVHVPSHMDAHVLCAIELYVVLARAFCTLRSVGRSRAATADVRSSLAGGAAGAGGRRVFNCERVFIDTRSSHVARAEPSRTFLQSYGTASRSSIIVPCRAAAGRASDA